MGIPGARCLDTCGCVGVSAGGWGDLPSGAGFASAAAQNQADI